VAGYKVVLDQTTEPTQLQWETAWIAQTGLAAPILPSATLVWIDANINEVGGIYGTTPLSTTVVRHESRYPISGNAFHQVAYLTSTVSTNVAIGINNSNHPTMTVNWPVRADMLLMYTLYVHLSSGTGTWGGDFMINGVKVGTRDLGIPTITGIINHAASGQLTVVHLIPEVAPGTYTIQAIMGVTGAPATAPTLAYGGIGAGAGQYGVRRLEVRGIAR
jgi:hypothetical protein